MYSLGGRLGGSSPFVPQAHQWVDVDADLLQHSPCSQEETCTDCVEHYRAYDQLFNQSRLYSRNIPRHEASQIVHNLSAAAKSDRELLRSKMAQHGDVFMSRWKKRSRVKREEILRKANANLPEKRYQDLFALTQSNNGVFDWRLSRTATMRLRLLLPYLATDSLKENPGLLFALLHYRTEYTLDYWATFDMNQIHNAWESGLLDINFCRDGIVAYGSRYGELMPFDEKLVHRGDMVGFPRAQLLLEAQSALMRFLVNVVEGTLDGANMDSSSSSKWSLACDEGFRASGDILQWSTYSNAPFSAPPLLDLDALITTAQLRFDAVADHLGLLQTDPAYARRYIRLVQQGKAYRCLGENSFDLVDCHIAADVMNLYWWLGIKEEAEHVKSVQQRFQDQIHHGSPLPPKYENALAAFELVLVNIMIVRCNLVRNESQQRPGFQKYYSYRPIADDKLEIRQHEPGRIPEKFFSDPLYWCMMNMTDEPDREGSIEHGHVFSFLDDYLASASTEERARLDQIVVERLSDVAANHQMLLAVRLSRPQNKAGEGDVFLRSENRRVWRDKLDKGGRLAPSATRARKLREFYETSTPHGRRDRAWLDQFDKVHASLADYWKALRPTAADHMKDANVAKYIQVDLAPEHQAELESYRQAFLAEISSKIVTLPVEGLQQLSVNDVSQTQVVNVKKEKSKKKTRPTDEDADSRQVKPIASPVDPIKLSSEPSAAHTCISTTKRAVTLFAKMFSKDAEVAGQGCDWEQFVLAMQDVGFEARNSTGSAVQFDPAEKGKIVFHKPHPVPKVDNILLKAMGKRLRKWFGFDKETFVYVVGGLMINS